MHALSAIRETVAVVHYSWGKARALYFVRMGLAMFSTTKRAILSMLLRVSAPKDAKLFGIMSSNRVEYSVGR